MLLRHRFEHTTDAIAESGTNIAAGLATDGVNDSMDRADFTDADFRDAGITDPDSTDADSSGTDPNRLPQI